MKKLTKAEYTDKVKELAKKIYKGLGSPKATLVSRKVELVDNRYIGYVRIAYHNTDVVCIHLGIDCNIIQIKLDNGGWPTATTRRRINDVLHILFKDSEHYFSMYQREGEQKFSHRIKCENLYDQSFDSSCVIYMHKNGKVRSIH